MTIRPCNTGLDTDVPAARNALGIATARYTASLRKLERMARALHPEHVPTIERARLSVLRTERKIRKTVA